MSPASPDPAVPNQDVSIRSLISAEEIRLAVTQLGAEISRDYQDQPLTVLGVLTGSIMLVADLLRQMQLPLKLGLIQASSYRGLTTSPGELTINMELVSDITDRDVLLVDDIFDTGRTIQGVIERLQHFRPRSVRVAVLLWKQARTVVDLAPDYHCFAIPDEFVVGYGLDFNDEYRHLPYIAVLAPPDI